MYMYLLLQIWLNTHWIQCQGNDRCYIQTDIVTFRVVTAHTCTIVDDKMKQLFYYYRAVWYVTDQGFGHTILDSDNKIKTVTVKTKHIFVTEIKFIIWLDDILYIRVISIDGVHSDHVSIYSF